MKNKLKFLIVSVTIIFILIAGCVNQSGSINSPSSKPDEGPPLDPHYLPTIPSTPEDTPTIISTPTINP